MKLSATSPALFDSCAVGHSNTAVAHSTQPSIPTDDTNPDNCSKLPAGIGGYVVDQGQIIAAVVDERGNVSLSDTELGAVGGFPQQLFDHNKLLFQSKQQTGVILRNSVSDNGSADSDRRSLREEIERKSDQGFFPLATRQRLNAKRRYSSEHRPNLRQRDFILSNRVRSRPLSSHLSTSLPVVTRSEAQPESRPRNIFTGSSDTSSIVERCLSRSHSVPVEVADRHDAEQNLSEIESEQGAKENFFSNLNTCDLEEEKPDVERKSQTQPKKLHQKRRSKRRKWFRASDSSDNSSSSSERKERVQAVPKGRGKRKRWLMARFFRSMLLSETSSEYSDDCPSCGSGEDLPAVKQEHVGLKADSKTDSVGDGDKNNVNNRTNVDRNCDLPKETLKKLSCSEARSIQLISKRDISQNSEVYFEQNVSQPLSNLNNTQLKLDGHTLGESVAGHLSVAAGTQNSSPHQNTNVKTLCGDFPANSGDFAPINLAEQVEGCNSSQEIFIGVQSTGQLDIDRFVNDPAGRLNTTAPEPTIYDNLTHNFSNVGHQSHSELGRRESMQSNPVQEGRTLYDNVEDNQDLLVPSFQQSRNSSVTQIEQLKTGFEHLEFNPRRMEPGQAGASTTVSSLEDTSGFLHRSDSQHGCPLNDRNSASTSERCSRRDQELSVSGCYDNLATLHAIDMTSENLNVSALSEVEFLASGYSNDIPTLSITNEQHLMSGSNTCVKTPNKRCKVVADNCEDFVTNKDTVKNYNNCVEHNIMERFGSQEKFETGHDHDGNILDQTEKNIGQCPDTGRLNRTDNPGEFCQSPQEKTTLTNKETPDRTSVLPANDCGSGFAPGEVSRPKCETKVDNEEEEEEDGSHSGTSMLKNKKKPRSRLKKFLTSLLSLSSSSDEEDGGGRYDNQTCSSKSSDW